MQAGGFPSRKNKYLEAQVGRRSGVEGFLGATSRDSRGRTRTTTLGAPDFGSSTKRGTSSSINAAQLARELKQLEKQAQVDYLEGRQEECDALNNELNGRLRWPVLIQPMELRKQ